MPMVAGVFGPVSATAVVDSDGTAAVTFQATGQQIKILNMSVVCSSAVLESTATVYKNQVGALYRLSATTAGSTGDNNADEVLLRDGERVFVVWTGADVGATATATISGEASVNGGGFRAMV